MKAGPLCVAHCVMHSLRLHVPRARTPRIGCRCSSTCWRMSARRNKKYNRCTRRCCSCRYSVGRSSPWESWCRCFLAMRLRRQCRPRPCRRQQVCEGRGGGERGEHRGALEHLPRMLAVRTLGHTRGRCGPLLTSRSSPKSTPAMQCTAVVASRTNCPRQCEARQPNFRVKVW